MANLPPWLQISPEQFTQAAIAGGQQGYQAAASAGELAQKGLLSAVQLAQESAAKAAEIAVRREQINASLSENAARVSAEQARAEAQNQIAQQDLELQKLREARNASQFGQELASKEKMNTEDVAGRSDVATIMANRPLQEFADPEIIKLQKGLQTYREAGLDKQADEVQAQIDKLVTAKPATEKLTPDQQAELKSLGERQAEINLLLSKPSRSFFTREDKPPDPDLIKERDSIANRVNEILGRGAVTNAPAKPSGPLRYQFINGQYQLTQ